MLARTAFSSRRDLSSPSTRHPIVLHSEPSAFNPFPPPSPLPPPPPGIVSNTNNESHPPKVGTIEVTAFQARDTSEAMDVDVDAGGGGGKLTFLRGAVRESLVRVRGRGAGSCHCMPCCMPGRVMLPLTTLLSRRSTAVFAVKGDESRIHLHLRLHLCLQLFGSVLTVLGTI